MIANTTMGMSNAILTEAGLSFLWTWRSKHYQLGADDLCTGKQYITSAWWISAFAGIAIVITVLVFYLLGDGLNHVLNPKHLNRGAN